MGHRNTQFIGHTVDMETDQQGHSHLHPAEPCVFLPNYPQPNFNFHHMPEQHETTLFYGPPHYNTIQSPQHPSPNIDLAHYTPYIAPSSGIRDFPVQVNQGPHEQFSHYDMNIRYMDNMGGSYKRKNVEGPPGYFQYHTAGPSSSVARPDEPDATVIDSGTTFGPDSVMAHNGCHFFQGSYVAQPVHLPGHRMMDMHGWMQAPILPYVHVNANGACLEAGSMGMQGYHVTASNRSNSTGFLHPQIPQVHPNSHHPNQPIQGVRGCSVTFPPHVSTSSSRRIPAFQNVAEAAPAYLAPVPPTGFRIYGQHGHHRREMALDSNARIRNLPHLRVLPEDEVAILEFPGYHEAGDSIDQHRDMRLDIDHMSYEELLALAEQIGSVGTGLSDNLIHNNLKTRTFTSSAAFVNLEEATCPTNQQIDFCVICQTDYEDEDTMGTLECGHEYHTECVKKWLKMKNTCPVCKSTALKGEGKNS